jgi:malate synthase
MSAGHAEVMMSAVLSAIPDGVVVRGPIREGYDQILTPNALAFLADLERRFGSRRRALLETRVERQAAVDTGKLPDFRPETAEVRLGGWTVAPLPADLMDRRVEITGPVDRKMVINALNSGATHFMADLEDSNAPTWSNLVEGQINLRDAVAGTIRYEHPSKPKTYELNDSIATLLVRPRGLHLVDRHIEVDGQPLSASIMDFGLYFFHNAKALVAKGSGPYFYLPKLESHHEAKWWNDVFVAAQEAVGLDVGTIKATVLIETLWAAFEMDEILFALREHSAGLNCGRWDYIFSYIKTLRSHPQYLLPDRGEVTMTVPFMQAYTSLVIQTCHKRQVHAMGGMAAQIPIKSDPEANAAALAKVVVDKEREVTSGHDGTWVAHPGLVQLARDVFDAKMPQANQIAEMPRSDVHVVQADLLRPPASDKRTLSGLRHSIQVGVRYLEAWLSGNGCVPLYNLMEDAATAEICRAQVWQWIVLGAKLEDGTPVTAERFTTWLDEELASIRTELGEERFAASRFVAAADLFRELSTSDTLVPFLTLPAYDQLVDPQE